MSSEITPRRSRSGSFPGTLYARLGGLKILNKVVDKFFLRLRADGAFAALLKGRKLDDLNEQTKVFLAQALGGPTLYEGPTVAEAFAPVSIGPQLLERAIDHLEAAMTNARVEKKVIRELLEALSPLAKELGPQTEGAKNTWLQGAKDVPSPPDLSAEQPPEPPLVEPPALKPGVLSTPPAQQKTSPKRETQSASGDLESELSALVEHIEAAKKGALDQKLRAESPVLRPLVGALNGLFEELVRHQNRINAQAMAVRNAGRQLDTPLEDPPPPKGRAELERLSHKLGASIQQSLVLSLNATIEASRTPQGAAFGLIADEMRAWCKKSARYVEQLESQLESFEPDHTQSSAHAAARALEIVAEALERESGLFGRAD